MAQHDYNIADAAFPATRADMNNALSAIISKNSGATLPSTTAPGMEAYETDSGIIWQRNSDDSGWVPKYKIEHQGLVDQNGNSIAAADAGVTDAYAITLDPAPAAYIFPQTFRFKANTANTGAATLNVNSLGAVTIKKNYNADLETGDILANQIVEVVYDGANFQLLSPIASNNTAFPPGYRAGSHPTWTSVASVTIPAGYQCRDDSDSANIVVGTDLVVSLAASGALGLATGQTEGSSTIYDLFVCKGASGVTGIFSEVGVSPTLPSGYDLYKRKFPGGWCNDSSSDLIKSVFEGDLDYPTVYHRVTFSPTAASNPTNIVNTTSSLTNVDTNAFVPPDARRVILYHHHTSTSGSSIVQPAGDSSAKYVTQTQSASNGAKDQQKDITLDLDSSQQIDVTISSATNVIAVRGYVVTEAA